MTHWQRNDIALRVSAAPVPCRSGDHTEQDAPVIGQVANVYVYTCGCPVLIFEDGRCGLAARYLRIEPLEQLEQAARENTNG